MRRLLARIHDRLEGAERGAVLILVASSLIVLMGMAAMAIDYGWIFLNQLNTRKAAEAAALAGVVHMPLPDCADPDAGTEPSDVALDVASRNGYSSSTGATVTPGPGGTCARLNVTISRPINTFFLQVFGINTVTITEDATAEQLPSLKLGSDEPYLGEDPTVSGRNRNFFVAISGEDRTKGQGDAVAAEDRNSGGSNPEYDVPSYYYAFEVPEGSSLIGSTLYVQIFDPQAHDEGTTGGTGPGLTNDWVYPDNSSTATDGWNSKTRFRVYLPDDTPNQWTDNSTLVNAGCNDTYRGKASGGQHSSYNAALADVWVNTCVISSAVQGIYVIEVSSDYGSSDGTDMINGFSIRGSTTGGTTSAGAVSSTNDLQVYGLGTMSLWQFDTGSNPVFKVARLDDIYAGSSLIISLWDVSDIGSNASIEFVGSTSSGPGGPIDCDVRTVGDNVNLLANQVPAGGWTGDSNGGAGTTCKLDFSSGQYNNEWLQFRFDVPANYECASGSGSSPASPGCWIFVSYSVGGSITDRTTWAAAIDGQPIHLIP